MTGVNVKHYDSALISGSDADVGTGPFLPPRLDLLRIGCGIFDAMRRARVLPWALTSFRVLAGADPMLDRVHRHDQPAATGIAERSLTVR